MAHLTLQLGASVVVPFPAPPGSMAARRDRATTRRLRWKALLEAASVGEDDDAAVCTIRRPYPQIGVPLTPRAIAQAREGVSQ